MKSSALMTANGFVNRIGGHHHGVVRTPRLHAAFGTGKTFGQAVEFLKTISTAMRPAGRPRRPRGTRLEGVADDEDDLAEAGADGVVDRIVDDGLAVGTDTVHLFERPVAGAHARGEYQ